MSTPFSPRTPEEPMAFTNDEVLRGAFTAWIIFMTLLLVATSVLVGVSMSHPAWSSGGQTLMMILMVDTSVLLIGGTISAIAMALGAGVAKSIGRRLRRVRSIGVHVLAYTALGLVSGIIFAGVVRGMWIRGPLSPFDLVLAFPVAAVTLAVPLGWWLTARRALRMDAGIIRPRSVREDRDAAAEDAALNS